MTLQYPFNSFDIFRPRRKESTEVRITQNEGKESENLPKIEEITVGQAHKNTWKLN